MIRFKKRLFSLYTFFFLAAGLSLTSQTPNNNLTPGGANGMVFRFTKQVWLNPTVILAKQKFEQATNVKLLILPRTNASDTSNNTKIEKAFDKLLAFLVFKENIQGSIKFYFNPKNPSKPFSFDWSEDLQCKFNKFHNLYKDTIEGILNNGLVNHPSLNNFAALPFDSIIGKASRYCRNILLLHPAPCGENQNSEFDLAQINSTPAKLEFAKVPNTSLTYNGGYDILTYNELEAYYNTVTDLADGSTYKVGWKAIKDNDVLKLKLTKKQPSFDVSKLVFKNAKGTVSYNVSVNPDSTLSLSMGGQSPGSMAEVVAYYTPTTTPVQTYPIGAFNVKFYEPKIYNLVLVSLDDDPLSLADQSKLKDSLNKIYGPVFIQWNLSQVRYNLPTTISKSIHDASSGLLSNYMPDMQPIVSSFKNNSSAYNGNADNMVYILLGASIDNTEIKGYMPRARNTGFVFVQPEVSSFFIRTLAHEVGHGAFNLKHIFSSDELGEGNKTQTNNLMDYASGRQLYKHQWDLIHDPSFVGWFEGDDEEASAISNMYALDEIVTTSINTPSNTPYVGLTPQGQIISNVTVSPPASCLPLISSSKPFVINGFGLYNGAVKIKSYWWKTPSGKPTGYYDAEDNILQITTKSGNYNVKVYQLFGNGCHFQWQSIQWQYEAGVDVAAVAQQKIVPNNWQTKTLFQADPSCYADFVQKIINKDKSQECLNASVEQIDAQAQLLAAYVNSVTINQDSLVNTINSLCNSAIKKLSYNQLQSLFTVLASSSSIKEEKEVAILRLMSCIPTTDYPTFYSLLESQNGALLRNLIARMHDKSIYPSDGNNYTSFIGALCWMFQHNNRIDQVTELGEANLLGQIINFNPYHFKDTPWASAYTGRKRFNFSYNENDGTITIYQQQGVIVSSGMGGGGESWEKIGDDFPAISPLSPVIVVLSNDELPLVKTALESAVTISENTYVVPAIFLKYRADKNNNEAIEKGIMITLDVVTIYASGGTALLTKIGWARRIWAMTEVAGALGNLSVNTGVIQPTDALYPAVQIYNSAMLLVGVKHLAGAAPTVAKGIYNFAKALPTNTKALLTQNQNLRALLMASYLNWRIAITNLPELTTAEKQLVNEGRIAEVTSIPAPKLKELDGQEKTWRALGMMDGAASGVGNLITTATKAITKQRLPSEFVDALKSFGRTEDEILEYFTKYHNDNGFRFLNEAEDLVMQFPALTKAEAYSLWGYTTNNFYFELNDWLRRGINITKTQNLKNILTSALAKVPKYNGTAFRAIKLEGQALTDFLNKHSLGSIVTYDDFISCGSTQTAAFFTKPGKNIQLTMEVNNAPIISDFADGIKFRGFDKDELLLLTGKQFKIISNELDNGIYKISLVQQ